MFLGGAAQLFAPRPVVLPLDLVSSFLMFLWYCRDRDRDATGRRRSLGRNIGVLMLPFITIPWYLMRPLPLRGKWRAFARFAGFVGLMLLAALAGTVAAALVAGLLGRDVLAAA